MNSTVNSTNEIGDKRFLSSALTLFSAYLNLFIICLGLVGNLVSFCVFRFHRSFKTMPSMVFLSFVAITDTLALFEWNLDHYYKLTNGVSFHSLNLIGCRFFNFTQYTSLQASGLLLSVMCIDRYVTVMAMPGSFLHRLPFRTVKTAFIWSLSVMTFCVLLNFHLYFTSGFIEKIANSSDPGALDCFRLASGMETSEWDKVNLVFYNIIPFLVMITFNTLLIVNLGKRLKKKRSNEYNGNASSKRLSLTVTLIIVSFLFLVMTTPGTIMFAFFSSAFENLHESVVFLIDDISFMNHAMLFFISFVSNRRFRRAVIKMCCFYCCCCQQTIRRWNRGGDTISRQTSSSVSNSNNKNNSNKTRLFVFI